MTRTREAIQSFLDNRKADSPFLLERYSTDLETQVMVTTGDPGEQPGTFTNGKETWSNKRWPYQAGTDPNYSDPQLGFSPAKFVEKVGTTWWDYVAKRSIAVGIDIDSNEGHAETTTTNDESQIESLIKKLSALDYVTIVRSTGGKGLHVYVFFDPSNLPSADNHHEHTIVARKTLEVITQDIKFPIKDHVDCVGSVFWIWASKSPADHPGFSVVKEGGYFNTNRLASVELPTPTFRGKSNTDFDQVEFDEEHKRVIEAIAAQPYYFNIREDMNLIHTHTCAIRDAIAGGLEVRGTFTTNSLGDDPSSANCFMAPQPGGVFRVYRFGQSQHEPDWKFIEGKNWCFFNDELSDEEAVQKFSHRKTQGKHLMTAEGAKEFADWLGEPLTGSVPDECWPVQLESGEWELHTKEATDGWEKSGKTFKRAIKKTRRTGSLNERLLIRADDMLRFVIQAGTPVGWFLKQQNGEWLHHKNFSDISCIVDNNFGENAKKAKELMVSDPWEITCIPFAPEYPGGRQWNRNAPALACKPADSGGDHYHFDLILEHIGGDLDDAVARSEWCRKGSILSGADYLRTWIACLIHHTDQPLPYLFLAGPQNSGKSVFHECQRYLFEGGITSANNSLTSSFNGELEGCFLVYVEERDLADKRHNSYEKIKEWVTGRELSIRALYRQQVMAPNFLHFVQMANNTTHLPLEDGDTRIVAIDVPALKKPIPKSVMEKHLKEEAPRFLRTLLNTVVPPPCDRLRIPALSTATKEGMERRAMSTTMAFRKERVFDCPGHKIEFKEFYKAYKEYCKVHGTNPDAEYVVLQEVMLRSDRFETGIKGDKSYLINVTLDEKAKPKKAPITTNKANRF